MPTPSALTGFIFLRNRRRADLSSAEDVRATRFITVAASEMEARSTLSRFFNDPWNFEITDKGSEILSQAEKLGIAEGDGKIL